MESKQYSIPKINKLLSIPISVYLSYGALLFLILVSLSTILDILDGSYDFSKIGEVPTLFFISLLWLPTAVNFNLDWKLQDGKLFANYFVYIFRWHEVNESNIESIDKVNTPENQNYDLWIVTVSKLTIWHRVIGFLNGNNWKPTILVSSKLTDYEELVEMLEEMTH